MNSSGFHTLGVAPPPDHDLLISSPVRETANTFPMPLGFTVLAPIPPSPGFLPVINVNRPANYDSSTLIPKLRDINDQFIEGTILMTLENKLMVGEVTATERWSGHTCYQIRIHTVTNGFHFEWIKGDGFLNGEANGN